MAMREGKQLGSDRLRRVNLEVAFLRGFREGAVTGDVFNLGRSFDDVLRGRRGAGVVLFPATTSDWSCSSPLHHGKASRSFTVARLAGSSMRVACNASRHSFEMGLTSLRVDSWKAVSIWVTVCTRAKTIDVGLTLKSSSTPQHGHLHRHRPAGNLCYLRGKQLRIVEHMQIVRRHPKLLKLFVPKQKLQG